MGAVYINTSGLLLDLIGVVLLFYFAVGKNTELTPRSDEIKGYKGTPDPQIIRKYCRFRRWGEFGFVLIFIRFALQMLATWWPYLMSGRVDP
jgi:hypothetical protein